jgi:hypothetical protein
LKLSIILLLVFPVIAQAEGWNKENDPFRFQKKLITNFNTLPNEGRLYHPGLAWPGSHWPNFLGGIAHRWSAGTPENFVYKRNGLKALKQLSPYQLNELSPAEKFDIYNLRYDYPMVERVHSELSPYENEWHGICHGFAPASMNHPEPQTIKVTNADGITLNFYSSDIAALMSYFYAKDARTAVRFVGSRCNSESRRVRRRHRESCEDVNAGAFHLIVANVMGLQRKSFIADIERYNEVWNHVAVSYRSVIHQTTSPDKYSAPGSVKKLQVETMVKYAGATAPKFDPIIGTENAYYAENTYEYYLDLNLKDEIIGGSWIGERRPDFLWTQDKASFSGEWESLNSIYQPVKFPEYNSLDQFHEFRD